MPPRREPAAAVLFVSGAGPTVAQLPASSL